MVGKLIQSREGEWLVEYTESRFPKYRYLFPVDLDQQEIQKLVIPIETEVIFSTRYHNYEMYAWVHDTY
jgi:hypothetical protein